MFSILSTVSLQAGKTENLPLFWGIFVFWYGECGLINSCLRVCMFLMNSLYRVDFWSYRTVL